MKIHLSSFALFILLLFNCIVRCLGAANLDSATDKHALLSFKNSITSEPHAILHTNWSENTSVCDWIGVTCGIKHQRVTALNLSGFDLAGTVAPHLGNLSFLRSLDIGSNNFNGFLPLELSKLRRLKMMNLGVNSFTGEIPKWLGSLSELEQGYLHNNSFSGSLSSDLCENLPNIEALDISANQLSGEIPPNIWKCRRLETLRLSINHFNGGIPSGIGNLSMLRYLYLGRNDFRGMIPEEIGNLSRLEILSIPGSSLTGEIPSSLFNISSLRFIDLSNNTLTGSIPFPAFNINLPKLEGIYLFRNNLQGHVPPNIWKCRNLKVLSLSFNNFSGGIPRGIGNLTMLTELYLAYNSLAGGLPEEIGSLSTLQYFTVYNNSLSGSISSSIFNISTLTTLRLSYNEFSGTLPSDLGNSLFNLEVLLLAHNRLSGPIPNSIINASQITLLAMNRNSFSGSIPDIGKLRLLQTLYIWGNNLSGEATSFLSSLTNCRYLRNLAVHDNPLKGILPKTIGNFSSSLEYMVASNNNLTGPIPSEIGNLSSLLDLYLFGNHLSGPIPPTVGRMKQLQRLYLTSNQLVGSIPNDLCRLNNLGDLGLSSNMLVGTIPECLGEVKSLRNIYLGSNHLNSAIPPNFWTLTDLVELDLSFNYFNGQLSSQLGTLKVINLLDLSSNRFSSDIPSLIDGCQSLVTLNLSNNQFTGSIPKALGNVRGLTYLDLSHNNLSGSIPKSLEHLSYLQHFNMSNNKLEGEIPDEGQFGHFPPQSFSHNFALCGSPRLQVQPCSKTHPRSNLWKFLVPSVILAVIFVGVIFVFVRRHKQQEVELSSHISPITEWRRITYVELERGTSCFGEIDLLGRGSFGSVYQCTLSDGLKVAVKVFNLYLQGAARSFDTETEILSSIRHRNLVQLIGCCSNTEFRALILTYMPNGSLDKWLHSSMYCLDFMQRLKIAIDVAAALEYLHHGYAFPIVHCDVKPSNVLLDLDMTAHLSDFGISKMFEGGEAFAQTQTLATIGYAAPELGMEGKVSTNGDVYSFGIMLLEIFTGKKPTDDMFGREMSIREWVSEALKQNAAPEIMAVDLLSTEDRDFSAKDQCVLSIFDVAMKCLEISADERIYMNEAAAALHKIKATVEAATERCRPQYALSVSIAINEN